MNIKHTNLKYFFMFQPVSKYDKYIIFLLKIVHFMHKICCLWKAKPNFSYVVYKITNNILAKIIEIPIHYFELQYANVLAFD